MQFLYLSTGIFNDTYGQQTFEWHFLSSLIIQQPQDDFEVLLLKDYTLPVAWQLVNPHIKFIFCGNKIRIISKIKFGLFFLWSALLEKPKLIICAHINLSVICLAISRLLKIKYILLTHGVEVWKTRNKFKLLALKRAFKIISVSRYTILKIQEQISRPENDFILIPNTVDTEKFKPDTKKEELIKKYNLAGYKIIETVCRLDGADRDKGYEKVIMALPKVLEIIPNVKYLIVGKGDYILELKKTINNLNLCEYVIFAGYIPNDELPSYYNLCDCFVMPSKQEGFGIVFLEALACGKPVIAGNLDGSREALLESKLGLLVNPDDPGQIEEAIVKVLKKEVDSALLDAGFLRRCVVENFSLECFQQRASKVLSHINNENYPYR